MTSSIPEKYEFSGIIGNGSFGTVIRAKNLNSCQQVAIKKINNSFDNKIDAQRIYREIAYLKLFGTHLNIIKLLSVEKDSKDSCIFLVFELMCNDLQNVIKIVRLSDEQQRFIIYQIFRALNFIHSINVVHRDLKPSNILLSDKYVVKIADFGLTKVASSLKIPDNYVIETNNDDMVPMTEYIATRWYRAPELLVAASTYSTGIDIWSIGCIMGEILLKRPLFPGTNTVNQIECIMSALPVPSLNEIESLCSGYFFSAVQRAANRPKRSLQKLLECAPYDATELMENILKFHPDKRYDSKSCMKHKYLRKFFSEDHLKETPKKSKIDEEKSMTINNYKSNVEKIINEGNYEETVITSQKSLKNKELEFEKLKISEEKTSNLVNNSSTGLWW